VTGKENRPDLTAALNLQLLADWDYDDGAMAIEIAHSKQL
jgi:hypothetical protein